MSARRARFIINFWERHRDLCNPAQTVSYRRLYILYVYICAYIRSTHASLESRVGGVEQRCIYSQSYLPTSRTETFAENKGLPTYIRTQVWAGAYRGAGLPAAGVLTRGWRLQATGLYIYVYTAGAHLLSIFFFTLARSVMLSRELYSSPG